MFDPFTIACEVPVNDDERCGQIDLIRIIGNHTDPIIQVCDFKPLAHKEKKACSQLHYYKQMLQHCTGISSDKIELVYFDSTHAFRVCNPFPCEEELIRMSLR